MEKRRCILIAIVLTAGLLAVAYANSRPAPGREVGPSMNHTPQVYTIPPNYMMQPAPTGQREQAQKESTQVRVLQERLRRLTVEKNAVEAELREVAEELFRLHYVCDSLRVDTNMIYDEDIWPKKRFEAPVRVGQRALLGEDNKLKVDQVIDGNNFIGELSMPYLSGQTWLTRKETVWVKGISTAGFVDDSYMAFKKPMLVSGTKTFTTAAGGSSTIFVIEPTTWPEIEGDRMSREARNIESGQDGPAQPSLATSISASETKIKQLLSEGVIHSVDVDFNTVRIDPLVWDLWDIEAKQGLVSFFSEYFEGKGSTGRVTVLSSRNDTKLGTFSVWTGIKILQ